MPTFFITFCALSSAKGMNIKMIKINKLTFLVVCVLLLSGCTDRSYEQEKERTEQDSGEASYHEAIAKLEKLSVVMENQLPQIKYGEMDKRILDFYTESIKEEYVFYGRFSNLGYSYIMGVCKGENNPLAELQLGPKRGEFPMIDYNENYIQLGTWLDDQQFESVYQFPGIHTLFMSEYGEMLFLGINQPEDANLGIVFDQIINNGEQEYLELLHSKKAQILPPVVGAFIQVRSLEKGKYHCAYLPISQDEIDRIAYDESKIADEEIEKTAIAFYTSIGNWRNGENSIAPGINQAMLEKAKSHSLIKTHKLSEIEDIKRIELCKVNSPSVWKVIEDADTIKKVEDILRNSHFTQLGGCPYKNLLILTKTDGSTIELQLAADSCDGFILGSYTCFTPGKEQWKVLCELLVINEKSFPPSERGRIE